MSLFITILRSVAGPILGMSCTDFMEWVTGRGAQHFGVDVKDCPDESGKGLFATTDFRESEAVICVPPGLIITAGLIADMAEYSDIFKRSIYLQVVFLMLANELQAFETTPEEQYCRNFSKCRSAFRLYFTFSRYRLKPFEALVYFFMMEKPQCSKWAPYLKVLPKTFSTPAVLYPHLEPEQLPYNLRKSWSEQKNELRTMYKKVDFFYFDTLGRP